MVQGKKQIEIPSGRKNINKILQCKLHSINVSSHFAMTPSTQHKCQFAMRSTYINRKTNARQEIQSYSLQTSLLKDNSGATFITIKTI